MGAVMVVVFLAPIVVLLWAGASAQKERKSRMRDLDARQAMQASRRDDGPDRRHPGRTAFDGDGDGGGFDGGSVGD